MEKGSSVPTLFSASNLTIPPFAETLSLLGWEGHLGLFPKAVPLWDTTWIEQGSLSM